MPEYVYALHDFTPENEDEIQFSAGDRIEVIEKDEMYEDGWWQGRNLFGKVGLFPQSYTTSDPSVVQPQAAPQSNGVEANGSNSLPANQLQSLAEESDAESGKAGTKRSNGGHVMQATLTDVQQAIEQLGRSDRDGGASFSFASTRDGDTTDRELDTDRETDNELTDDNGNGWHKGGRSGLAEKARLQQQKELEREAALEAAAFPTPLVDPPPLQFEVESESEDEGEDMRFPHRDHARIPEEDEEEEVSARQTNGHNLNSQSEQTAPSGEAQQPTAEVQPSEEFIVPEPDEVETQTATARQVTFPPESLPSPARPRPDPASSLIQASSPTYLQPAPPLTPTSPTAVVTQQSAMSEVPPPLMRPMSEPELKKVLTPQPLPSPPQSQNGSRLSTSPPSEWSVEDVVEWAKSRGLDSTVCDKFIEHEISGDVLLELDEQILKTELEIHAFGKRKRIIKEVDLLRRPPSMTSVQLAPSQTHSHSFSQSISLPDSTQQSLHSPLHNILSPESPPHTGDISASPAVTSTLRRDSDPGSSFRVSVTDQESTTASNSMVGLGIGAGTSSLATSTAGSVDKFETTKKNRPAHLNLSPSENVLTSRSKTTGFSPKSGELIQDDRAALSDTESTRALESRTKRRRIFGRSTGSAHSDSKDTLGRSSTPTSVPGSPSAKRDSIEDSAKATQRRKRSGELSKPHDRHSFFSTTLSIGRSRKPPPRVQSYAHDDLATEKSSRSLSRLVLSGGNRRPSSRSQASDLNGIKEDREQNPGVLRKRTTSLVEGPTGLPGGSLKAGQSVLEQIGQPDHNGWMMKKGERYNTWKLRYFVLKGPHLYYLESNSKTLTKIKGFIDITGYKVIVDENVNPGRYGFRLIQENMKTHYFSSDEQIIVREWMKALMKATIGRDYTKPVISSCNIPTIPLSVAQTMNPAPRPPSPSQRDATQKALRRENPNQLSTRDARILMGLPSTQSQQENDQYQYRSGESFISMEPSMTQTIDGGEKSPAPSTIPSSTPTAPVRPSREARRASVPPVDGPFAPIELIKWADEHLPQHLRITENDGQVYSALALYRLAEAVKGRPTEPVVPDSAFPSGPDDDRLDGLFKLFDFFIDNDIRLSTNISINDVRMGKKDKVAQIVRALKNWEDKRKTTMRSFNRGVAQAGPFMALEPDR